MLTSVRVELPCPLSMEAIGGGLDAGWRDVAVVPAGRGVAVVRGDRYQDDAGVSGDEMGLRPADRLHRRHRRIPLCAGLSRTAARYARAVYGSAMAADAGLDHALRR